MGNQGVEILVVRIVSFFCTRPALNALGTVFFLERIEIVSRSDPKPFVFLPDHHGSFYFGYANRNASIVVIVIMGEPVKVFQLIDFQPEIGREIKHADKDKKDGTDRINKETVSLGDNAVYPHNKKKYNGNPAGRNEHEQRKKSL